MSKDRREPDAADGLMNDQEMPTADGQMASNTSEAVIPPRVERVEPPAEPPHPTDDDVLPR